MIESRVNVKSRDTAREDASPGWRFTYLFNEVSNRPLELKRNLRSVLECARRGERFFRAPWSKSKAAEHRAHSPAGAGLPRLIRVGA